MVSYVPSFFHFIQRSIELLLQVSVALTNSDTQTGTEVIFVRHFIADSGQFRIGFQPLGDHGSVTEYGINTTILHIQLGVHVAVVRHNGDFRVLVGDEFLVRGAVLHTDFFAFQRGDISNFAFLTDEQGRVFIVRLSEQHLFFTFWRDVHSGNHRVETTELQAWDQAVERLVGKGTGGVDLFTQGVRQIHIEAHDLIAGIHGFKRRVRRFHGKTNRLCCGSGKADAGKQRGYQYFFHCHFP